MTFKYRLLCSLLLWISLPLSGMAQKARIFPDDFFDKDDGFQITLFYTGDVQGNFLPCG